MHGWPFDPRCYDEVVPLLVAAGCRVIVPYLRGFGPTRFLSADTMRSGQQAALGNDLRELMDALRIERAVVGGYDWGGRAACIVSALWPERVRGLVTGNGYNIQDIAASVNPVAPAQEHRFWYQYYFHTPRGRAGLEQNRRAFCRLLWQLWSPTWTFDDADQFPPGEFHENDERRGHHQRARELKFRAVADDQRGQIQPLATAMRIHPGGRSGAGIDRAAA